MLEDLIANKKASGRTKDIADVEVLEGGFQEVTKTVKIFRMEYEKEDYFWTLALDDSECLEIATRLVGDLWSAAHEGSPFPSMDRTIYNYMPITRI